jgi:hypothetical protein
LESSASDPFSSFLASAKKNRGPNNRRNGNFTPRNKNNDNSKTAQPGQFDDAEKKVAAASGGEQPVKKRNYNNNNNNNNNNNSNNNNNNNRNNNNRNRKNREQQHANQAEGGEQRQQPRRKNMRRKTQPDEVRTRRATAFIDKDIDWASFDTAAAEVAVEVKDGEQESNELLLKDVQGDYDRYLAVGSDVNWGKAIDSNSVSTLIGSNATFDYQQKTAFLSALSSATGGVAARK